MSSRKRPIEIASDIGAKAADLHAYGHVTARPALRHTAQGNTPRVGRLGSPPLAMPAKRPYQSPG